MLRDSVSHTFSKVAVISTLNKCLCGHVYFHHAVFEQTHQLLGFVCSPRASIELKQQTLKICGAKGVEETGRQRETGSRERNAGNFQFSHI